MKRNICIILAGIMLTSALTGCGKSKSKSKASDINAASTVASKKQEEKQDEYIVNLDDSFDSGIELESARVTLAPEEADFRNLKWGMSKDEVINAEGTGFSEPTENVMYYTRVREEGYPADAEYTFVDEKLAQGIFYITENKDNKPVKPDDYAELVNSLKERFGEPQLSDEYFYNESDKTDDKSKHKELILQNKLNYRTRWTLDGTDLRVVMVNRQNKLCIGLQYKQEGITIPQPAAE